MAANERPHERLKRLRDEMGYTCRELAKAAGVSADYVNMLENPNRKSSMSITMHNPNKVRRIAEVLGCRVCDIIESPYARRLRE